MRIRFAMILFLISEGAFFVFLIIAYVYFHGSDEAGPNAMNSLHPLTTGVFTVALLASSFTMWRAEKSHARGQFGSFRNWLAVTIALGAIFMVGQGREYFLLYRSNVTVSRNVFGSSFFTLTGFHGLHVVFGIIALGILLGPGVQGFRKTAGITCADNRSLLAFCGLGVGCDFLSRVLVGSSMRLYS